MNTDTDDSTDTDTTTNERWDTLMRVMSFVLMAAAVGIVVMLLLLECSR